MPRRRPHILQTAAVSTLLGVGALMAGCAADAPDPVITAVQAYVDAIAAGDAERASALIDSAPSGAEHLEDALAFIENPTAGQAADDSWTSTTLDDGATTTVPVAYELEGEEYRGTVDVRREGEDYLVVASPEQSAPPTATWASEDGFTVLTLYAGVYGPEVVTGGSPLLTTDVSEFVGLLGGSATFSAQLSDAGIAAADELLADGTAASAAEDVLAECAPDGAEISVVVGSTGFSCGIGNDGWLYEIVGDDGTTATVVDGNVAVRAVIHYTWVAETSAYESDNGVGAVVEYFLVDGDMLTLAPDLTEVYADYTEAW
ncbi:hypothetical protein [Microbacterium sp. NPDC055683]